MSIAPDTRLGPYRVLSPLGAGGMGEVYRAHDERLGREVAVKVLPAESSADPDRLRRFEQEARAVGALNHPNLVAVFDTGRHEGNPYVVFELLEGATLRQRLGGGPLPARKAVDYAVQIAQGLAAAHEKGIVHRDLKPENLFVTKDGRVKILDFGLAKLRPALDPDGSRVEGETARLPQRIVAVAARRMLFHDRLVRRDQRSHVLEHRDCGARSRERGANGPLARERCAVQLLRSLGRHDRRSDECDSHERDGASSHHLNCASTSSK